MKRRDTTFGVVMEGDPIPEEMTGPDGPDEIIVIKQTPAERALRARIDSGDIVVNPPCVVVDPEDPTVRLLCFPDDIFSTPGLSGVARGLWILLTGDRLLHPEVAVTLDHLVNRTREPRRRMRRALRELAAHGVPEAAAVLAAEDTR